MATDDGSGAKRSEAQPARPRAPAGGDNKATTPAESRRGGETLPQATAAYLGPKLGLPHEFGRYRVQKPLGGGGMGAVFLVVNTELQREEALKVPHFEAADDPEVHERFLREARAAAGLDHPNLCPVYDVGVHDGIYYLTMRYLKGKLLSDHTGTAQPPRKAVEIVTKLAQALAAAHAKGVIHRDLKPNNVMMCAGVGPVVMDFGLAKQNQGENQKLTQAGTTLGTPAYMPPEQVTGDLDRIGPASDVYSLGVILFELLTGTLPFRGKTVGEVYGNICHTEAPAPSSLRPGLNPALDAICRKAMAKTPEGRYPSMKAFAAALIDFLKATPPGEGAGALTVTKAGPADIFQVPTVAPNHAAPSTPNPRTVRATNPGPKGSRARFGVRKPVPTQRAMAAGNVDEDRGGRSVGGVLGLFALVLLMIGALSGVGYLVYRVSQNKTGPSASAVAVVTPASASANDRPAGIPTGDGPTADLPKDRSPKSDPPKGDLPKVDPKPKSDPPKIDAPPRNDPPKFDPVPKVDPPKIDPPKNEAKDKAAGAEGPKTGAKSRTKASNGGVDYELVKCVRNPSNPKRVTFTFSAQCDMEDRVLAGNAFGFSGFSLVLTARGGEALEGKVKKGPPLPVMLTKGVASKFQISYEEVDQDITEFDEVQLAETNFGRAVKFYNIKIELLKNEAKDKAAGAEGPKTGAKSRTKASNGGVDYELVKCVRNPSNPKRVTFTFSAQCDMEDRVLAGNAFGFSGFSLVLTARGGEALEGKVKKGPPLPVMLTKGVASKFQISYEEVDQDITEFDEVQLAVTNSYGRAVKFYNIKIEAK